MMNAYTKTARRLALTILTVILARGPCAAAEDAPPNREQVEESLREVEVVRSIPFARYNDKTLLADIYRPRDATEPLPGILMVHGGAWFAGDKAQITTHARYAAGRGYAVMAINYRKAPIYKFPAQLDDCRRALQWLGENATQYGIDRERLAGYGYSAGGHLVSLLGMTSGDALANEPLDRQDAENAAGQGGNQSAGPPRLRAIVAGGAPCDFDWIPADARTLAYWLGGSRAEKPDAYRAASPASHVDATDPPVFFFHGAVDRVVPLSSPQRMKARLQAAGVASVLYVVPAAQHVDAFLAPESRRAALDFLDGLLQPSPAAIAP